MKRGKRIGKRSLPAEKKKGSKKLKQTPRTPSPQPLSSSSSSSSSESSSDEEEKQISGNGDASMPVVWSPSDNADIGDNAVTYSYGEASQGGSSSNLLEEALNSIDLPVKHGNTNDVSDASQNLNNVVSVPSCSNSNTSKPSKKQSATSSSASKDKPLKLKPLRSFPSLS